MPRPNRNRTMRQEANVRRRIAYERARKGMSYDGLADRMTRAGCAINQTALYRLENAEPPRKISVNELFAFAEVFELSVAELTVPPELIEEREVFAALDQWREATAVAGRANQGLDESLEHLREELQAHPGATPAATRWLETYVQDMWGYEGERQAEGVEYLLLTLSGVARNSPEWTRHFERFGSRRNGDD